MNLMTRLKALLLLLVSSVALSGCDFNVYELPLPGGTDVGEDPIEVTVMFADVLDLVPKSTVKVNDVSVGMVTDVNLKGYVAEVKLELRNDVSLPENTVAELRQTSLLGEKFVSLGPPEDEEPTGTLETDDVIPMERTGRNPEVEEVLGALSLLLNGGGVGQLQTITRELNFALEGREDAAKSAFRQIEELMAQLDENKGDIVNAIEALNRLALSTKEQLGSIDAALEELPSALEHHRPAACRPGQDAAVAQRARRRRRARDQGVQGRHDRVVPPALADPDRARQHRRQLREGLPRVPDLPVRGRGRRSRPAGRPQPAHG